MPSCIYNLTVTVTRTIYIININQRVSVMDESILSTKHMRKTYKRIIIGFKTCFCFEELKPWKRQVTYCCTNSKDLSVLFSVSCPNVSDSASIQICKKISKRNVDQRRNEKEEKERKAKQLVKKERGKVI